MASVSNITNKVINNLGTDEQVLATTGSNQKGACVGLSLANTAVMITSARIGTKMKKGSLKYAGAL